MTERPVLDKDDDFQNQWFAVSISQSGSSHMPAIALRKSWAKERDEKLAAEADAQKAAQASAESKPAVEEAPSKELETSALESGVQKKVSPVQRNLEGIRQYAYDAFDRIDTNKNGFIETDELYAALEDEATPMREKSYIMFLLTNHGDIADNMQDGISRSDIEKYFEIVLSRLEQSDR